MLEDLAAFVAGMDLAPAQKSAFEADLAAARQRQEEMRKAMEASRQATAQQRPGAGGPPMMMMGGARQQQANAGGQMRQRMLERFQQDFAGFFATLQPAQREAVERELANLAGARRATVYRLEGGKPVPVMVRLGASDGSSTEISGNVTEGDLLVTGERAAAR